MNGGAQFKQKLREGRRVAVINADYPSSALVEFLGLPELAVDAVMLDTEQGSLDVHDVEEMARAARLTGLCVLVRLFSPEPWVIERLMLRGIDGIIVPRLDAGRQAREVVDCVHYCFPRDAESKVIVIQIESSKAHDDLDAFLAVDGIDVYFVGPVDLSKSMGFQGDYTVPQVDRAVSDILHRTNAAGRVAGMLVKPGDAEAWTARGVRLAYFHVNDWLRVGARSFPWAGEK
ncbi:MAG: 2,4-dihydroxyhept-2-ene-1,7-dioic acid aldolase [Acidobacteria bacterium RIFCSPLOWO2_12_FULL_67_14b]|nr:MAG: 2,4-dihydroxyhept-2-ene-1,7-dioic acid aldolase [Acidobacteria bacterium RIFCSPLOWO2_12_FULL_67_14b]